MANYFFLDTSLVLLIAPDFTVRGRLLITRYTGKTLNSMKKLKNSKNTQPTPGVAMEFEKDTNWMLAGKY